MKIQYSNSLDRHVFGSNAFFNVLHKTCQRSLLVAIAIGGLSACGETTAKTEQVNVTASPTSNHSGMSHGEMSLGNADIDYDLRFIDAMIPHHEGAVSMAKAVLQNSQRPELKKLASEMIQAQNQEIAAMKQWRKTWYAAASETPMAWHSGMNHMMAMTPEQRAMMRMDVDLGKPDPNFDLRFINAMIPHHEGAVMMAKDALAKSTRPEIKKLAQDIISSQQSEIKQMQEWRKTWYKQ